MTSTLLLLLAVTSASPGPGTDYARAPAACAARSGAVTLPLVELYTSEGCSSCPAADRWFSRQRDPDAANWLAFHVDYWDELGWRDRFGAPAHTRRQRERAWAWSSATIYTPQVMLGPTIHAPWRTPPRFAALLRAARTPARAGLAMRVHRAPSGNWQVRVAAARVAGSRGTEAQLWLARWVDDQHTAVKAGENRGVALRHDHVVQGLWGPWALDARATTHEVTIAPLAGKWGMVAFVQDARGDTLQSLELAASRCPATEPTRVQ
ncbi:MAG: DUF1223 domain-containing protein [Arenimonas sp.]